MTQSKTWTLATSTTTRVTDTGTSGQGSGAATHLIVGRFGAAGTRRQHTSYVKFSSDWTDVLKLVSATLSVYTDDLSILGVYGAKVPRVTVRKLTGPFVEGSSVGFAASDYTAPPMTTVGQVIAHPVVNANGVTNIDVLAIVKSWAPATVQGGSGTLAQAIARNYGFALVGSTSANEPWAGWSDEYATTGQRPTLTLVYELGPTIPNTPTTLTPDGTVDSIGAFEADFSDVRATDTLVSTQVQVYVGTAVKSGTGVASNNNIAVTAHGYTANQEVWFHSLTGGTGLSVGTAYYVKSPSTNAFLVSLTPGGATVDITVNYSALTVAAPKWSKVKAASETEVVTDHSFVLPDGLTLTRNLAYKWRVRQKDNDALWSPWTALTAFTVTNDDPTAPSAQSPDADGSPAASDFADLNGVIFRGTFGDINSGDYMLAFQCQLSAFAEGNANWDDASMLKWDTGKQYVGLDTTVSEAEYGGTDLTAGTWYWRVRHWDQHDGLSNWSYARIVLTADFNPDPGSQTSIQVDPNAPWRVRIREMAFNSLAATTGTITGVAATDLFTSSKNHALTAGRKVRFSAITGGTGLFTGVDYWVIASGLTATAFKVSATNGGSAVNFTTAVTAAVLTGVTTRGPGNQIGVIENAKSVGASIVYNSPGEAHFTLPVDHPQLSVVEPKQVHYGIDFYTGDGWRETFAGLVWDVDANETDAVFPCMDYLALLDSVSDERYFPAEPDRTYTKGGSKYTDVTIRNVVIDQLTRATSLANSPVGFISIGAIATMSEKVTIWSTMQPVLSFISGLLDSHRQGTGKKTRISVKRNTGGSYSFIVEDAPGQTRDNLRLRYGELVNGYRVVVFGINWSSVLHTIGRTREGIRVLYKTEEAPNLDQRIWGRFARAIIVDNVSDENDLARRTKQAAIKFGKFGQSIAMAIRTGLLKPRDGYDVCDDFPVDIVHGAINTGNYGSGYYTCWAIGWEAKDDGSQNVVLTISPREDTTAPHADLIDSHNISTQAEWQIGWTPPDPVKATSKYWVDQNTGKVYLRDDGILTALDVTVTV